MTAAKDELVNAIAKGLGCRGNDHHDCNAREEARDAVAALVERYGEPEIENHNFWDDENQTYRRLVFPWQAVKEGTPDE